jgi:hypothetical protein
MNGFSMLRIHYCDATNAAIVAAAPLHGRIAARMLVDDGHDNTYNEEITSNRSLPKVPESARRKGH